MEKSEPSFKLAQKMFSVVEQNREHVLSWLDWVLPEKTKTAEDSFRFMLNNDENWKKGTCFDYLLHLKSTNQIIGGVGVSCLDIKRPHKIEIGYWQDQKFCGHGYIREAVQLIENEFFNLGIVRIIIRNDVENEKSINVAKALKYHHEGINIKDRWNETLKMYRDMHQWSKVR